MDIDKNRIYEPDIPMGLDIALAQNERANDFFYFLPEDEQKRIINHASTIGSKEEMQSFVNSLVTVIPIKKD